MQPVTDTVLEFNARLLLYVSRAQFKLKTISICNISYILVIDIVVLRPASVAGAGVEAVELVGAQDGPGRQQLDGARRGGRSRRWSAPARLSSERAQAESTAATAAATTATFH